MYKNLIIINKVWDVDTDLNIKKEAKLLYSKEDAPPLLKMVALLSQSI